MDGMDERVRPLGHKSMAEMLADELRRRILANEFAEGTQLRQGSLAAAYGVSRMPVRDALRQLETEGLVSLVPYRGAVVTVLSLEDVREVFDLRALLECDLIARAIPRLGPADIAAARAAAAAFDAGMAEDADGGRELGEANWRLHAALYAQAGRPRSMQILQTLHYQSARYVRAHVRLARGRERASGEHAAIIERSAAGDVAAAVALLERHIRRTGQDLIGLLEQRATRPASGGTTARAGRAGG